MAIQLIINREWGLAKNENPNQGAFIIDELTDLVEEAVLKEFEAISERGGVLGAMETGYQSFTRGRAATRLNRSMRTRRCTKGAMSMSARLCSSPASYGALCSARSMRSTISVRRATDRFKSSAEMPPVAALRQRVRIGYALDRGERLFARHALQLGLDVLDERRQLHRPSRHFFRVLGPQAHARAGIGARRGQARLRIGVLQVLVDDARFGEHLFAVDQHRDQARGIEREEFGLELIETPQLEVVAGPRQPLLGQADAHLLAAGRVRAVTELDRCRRPGTPRPYWISVRG